MHRTLFTTPGISHVLRPFSIGMLRLAGWRLEGALPVDCTKAVVIGAPHTSNWDLPYTLMSAFALKAHVHWMGKHSLFRFPFGALMQWLGGIAVNREKSTDMVAASASALRQATGSLYLVVSPEGTRSKTRYWKTGFYYIAQQAGVPIVMAYIDYSNKVVGVGPVFTPSGDIVADMQAIKAFYARFKGKNADQFEAS
jgi:1-acyl-sn-glycerol-3-phosphate acyltransferase